MLIWLLGCPSPTSGPAPHATLTDSTSTDGPSPTDSSGTEATGDTAGTGTDGTVHVGALVFDDHLPRNLLVVSLDTTRRDYLGRFSGNSDTPNLDGFLEESFALDNHRSCSNWTAWSMTCVVSGRNPMENGFAPWSYGDYGLVPNFPPASYETLPRVLTQAGWDTVLVTANSVFSSDTGVANGFAREVRVDWNPAEVVADAGMDEVKDAMNQAKPWYVQVHFIDPHGDYCPPEGYYDLSSVPDIGISATDVCYGSYDDAPYYWSQPPPWQEAYIDELHELYRGELRYWDTQFGEFIDRLDAQGALEDTLVMFVTDHGQQFFERDEEGYGGHGHGIFLGAEENRSTAAFWAKNLHPGSWSGLTVHQDLTETLYEMYGLSPITPTSGILVGTGAADRTVRGENFWGSNPLLSVTQGDHSLVYDWYGGRHFYKLESDPSGVKDVYDPTDPDVVALWPAMSDWIDDVQGYWSFLGEPYGEGP